MKVFIDGLCKRSIHFVTGNLDSVANVELNDLADTVRAESRKLENFPARKARRIGSDVGTR